MNQMMYVDEINKAHRNFLKNYESAQRTDTAKEPGSFLEKVNQKVSQNQIDSVCSENQSSAKDRNMAEYKEYIYNKISQIPIHPSRVRDSIAVFITDAGFERMKNDPEYEKWVLDILRKDFAVFDPWAERCGGSFIIHRFGETESEYRGESWRKDIVGGKSRYDKTAEESFWERRRKRKKRIEEIMKQRDKQKRELEKLDQKIALTRESYRDFLEGKRAAFLTHR